MELINKLLADIIPYDKNPRKNDSAVNMVMESIRQCEYIAPIVIDENNIILAGHTRYKALKKLGYKEAQIIIKSGLTDEQKQKYRLLDNKTNEFSEWDYDLLSNELYGLDFGNLDIDWGIIDSEDDLEVYNDSIYTEKTDIPQYQITGEKVSLSDCVNTEKYEELIKHIDTANISEKEKVFLKIAACRHYVFSYNKIAEYYAQASCETQKLMEESALVIIDYQDAIKYGYVKLTKSLREVAEYEE